MDAEKISFSSNDIYTILEKEIITLKLLPGEYISEIEISKRFGVSRTPIRDVFKRLELRNLIKVIPQKGTIITPVNLGMISEFMFVREKIEVGIIEEIIPTLSPAQFAELQLLLIQQRKIIENKKLDIHSKSIAFFDLDNHFHLLLYKLAGRETLWTMFINIIPDYQRYRAISAECSTEEDLQKLYLEHQKIFSCIEQKSPECIHSTYKEHIYGGIQSIPKLVQEKEDYFLDNI